MLKDIEKVILLNIIKEVAFGKINKKNKKNREIL